MILPRLDQLHVGILAADLTHQHGWAHYSISMIHALRRAGVSMTILTTRNSPIPHGLEAHTLLPTVDPFENALHIKLLALIPRARRLLRDCDVIHTFVEPFAPLAYGITGSRPLFITGHGSYVRVHDAYRPPLDRLHAAAFRRATLLCVSEYTARAARQAVPNVKTVVIPNGIDMDRFTNLPPLEKNGRTVLFVGAVKPRKGVIALVRAMALVRETIPDARCLIAGSTALDHAYVERVRAEIKTHNLSDSVQLLGRVSDEELTRLYASADVFAMPSVNDGWKFEGFGLSLLEASAAGLPVIGTRDCGAESAVDDDITGLLIPQLGMDETHVEPLSGAITRLLREPDLRARMGLAGRAKAQSHTWDDAARHLITHYAHPS